jgi:hypothetical protein
MCVAVLQWKTVRMLGGGIDPGLPEVISICLEVCMLDCMFGYKRATNGSIAVEIGLIS